PAPSISVSISPTTASLAPGGTQTFTATVNGTTSGQSTAVTWAVVEGSAGGTVDGGGRYSAPSSGGTFHLRATSVADGTKSATATVTVTSAPSISVSVAPSSTSLAPGASQTFTATVSGTTAGQSTAVSWAVDEGASGGTVDGSGHYTAPGSN